MRRRTFIAAGAGISGAGILSACGSDEAATSAEAVAELSADTEAKLDLSYWNPNQSKTVDALIASFNEKYPKITVTASITPSSDYWTKLRTQAEGDNLPDVFWMNGLNYRLYASNDMLLEVPEDAAEWSKYPSSLVDLYTFEDRRFGIPKDFDTIGCWINRSLFEQAGLEIPDGTWTWDDFRAIAESLRASLPSGSFAVVGDYLQNGQLTYYNTIGQADGYVIRDGKSGYRDDNTQRGLEFWTQLTVDGLAPSPKVMGDLNSRELFNSQRVAMMFAGSWEVAPILDGHKDPSDTMALPLPQDVKRASVIHGLVYAASKNTSHPAAALALIQHMTNAEAAQVEAENGTAIPAYEGYADRWVERQPHMNLGVFLEAANDYAIPYPVSINTAAWNIKETEILVPAFAGEVPVAEAATKLADEMDRLLEAE